MCMGPPLRSPYDTTPTQPPRIAARGRSLLHLFILRSRLAHRFNQNFCDFWAGEFARRDFASLQHLTHLCAAECYMLITAMRAGFRRGHRITGTAEEGMIKKHGRNAEFRRVELGKDVLSVIGAIIVADTGMVAPYDEMRTP